jgi:hypothetical protein
MGLRILIFMMLARRKFIGTGYWYARMGALAVLSFICTLWILSAYFISINVCCSKTIKLFSQFVILLSILNLIILVIRLYKVDREAVLLKKFDSISIFRKISYFTLILILLILPTLILVIMQNRICI